jgi:hypothetical protein
MLPAKLDQNPNEAAVFLRQFGLCSGIKQYVKPKMKWKDERENERRNEQDPNSGFF